MLISRPDLPISYIGLSLGLQDPRGAPTNYGTHSQMAGSGMIGWIKLRQKFMSELLFTKFSSIQLSW